MKNLIHPLCGFLLLLATASCEKNNDELYADYLVARPLTMSLEEFRNSVDIVAPIPIQEKLALRCDHQYQYAVSTSGFVKFVFFEYTKGLSTDIRPTFFSDDQFDFCGCHLFSAGNFRSNPGQVVI